MSHSESASKSRSRSNASRRSFPYLATNPEDLLLPEGNVTEEQVGLLQEFIHPRRHTNATESTAVDGVESYIENDEDEDSEHSFKGRPWYRRPSPLWLLCITPITSIAMTACTAPRVEIYTRLVCHALKPEFAAGGGHEPLPDLSSSVEVSNVVNGLDDNLGPEPDIPLSSLSSLLRLSPRGQNDIIAYLHPRVFSTSAFSEEPQFDAKISQCASDPVVQAAAAKLIAVLTTATGLLSCLTTGFWGSLSDRYGRLRVLGLCVVGLLINDITFIGVNFLTERFPGGYWFLLLGALAEGLFGGLSTVVAAMHAYYADCVPSNARSRVFALGSGLLFVGMGIGPTLGSLLIHETHNPLSVFYGALVIHIVYAFWLWFVVPESLTPAAMRRNRHRQKKREEAMDEDSLVISDHRSVDGIIIQGVKTLSVGVKKTFAFLSPLSVFAPTPLYEHHNKHHIRDSFIWDRDWSLTLIVLSYGFSALLMGSYQYKFQYAQATFGWTSEELGYFLSIIGVTRAAFLTVILPFIIRTFNKPKPAIRLPTESSESLHIPPSPEPSNNTDLAPDPSASESSPTPRNSSYSRTDRSGYLSPPDEVTEQQHKEIAPHSPKFDLHLARSSLILDAICYSIFTVAVTPMLFVGVAMLLSLGGGFNPAASALALELYTRRELRKREMQAEVVRRDGDGEAEGMLEGRDERGLEEGDSKGTAKNSQEVETGRLFGAISVVQALCTQILGPSIFGLVYMSTVATHPLTIFWTSVGMIVIALICISFVRLPSSTSTRSSSERKPQNIVIRVDVDVSTSRDGSIDRGMNLLLGNGGGKRREGSRGEDRDEENEEMEVLGTHGVDETLVGVGGPSDTTEDIKQRHRRGRGRGERPKEEVGRKFVS